MIRSKGAGRLRPAPGDSKKLARLSIELKAEGNPVVIEVGAILFLPPAISIFATKG